MEMTYEQRLRLMHQLCQAQTRADSLSEAEAVAALANTDIEDSTHYLASFLTFRAIQAAGVIQPMSWKMTSICWASTSVLV